MSVRGHNGGFDPFRSHGRFASAGVADATSDAGAHTYADRIGVKNDTIGAIGKPHGGAEALNAALRSAAGRPTLAGGPACR